MALSAATSERVIANLLDQLDALKAPSSTIKTPQHKWGTNTQLGSAFPSVKVDIGFYGLDPKAEKDTAELVKGKKVLWVTLPGAFTPT